MGFLPTLGTVALSVGTLCLLLCDGVCVWEQVSMREPSPFVVPEGGWGRQVGAFSAGPPSPQSESSCRSYTKKVGSRATGQRSHSHEGVGQGLNPLGILAPPQSECASGKREPAPWQPLEHRTCPWRSACSAAPCPPMLEEEQAQGTCSEAMLSLWTVCASAKGSRLHGLALKGTVGVTPVSAGWLLCPASLAVGGTGPDLLCDLCQCSHPGSVLPARWVEVAGCWGADVDKAAFLGDRMQETRGPGHSFTVQHTQF